MSLAYGWKPQNSVLLLPETARSRTPGPGYGVYITQQRFVISAPKYAILAVDPVYRNPGIKVRWTPCFRTETDEPMSILKQQLHRVFECIHSVSITTQAFGPLKSGKDGPGVKITAWSGLAAPADSKTRLIG